MSAEIQRDALPDVVDRARAHDADAWEALYRHCHPRLLTYARRRLHDRQAAEDAVSDAFMRAMERIDTFTWQGAGFDGWMYGILRNVVLESYRSADRSRRLVAREGAMAASAGPAIDAPVERHVEASGETALLLAAFATLSESDREVLELRVVGELSADAAGSVLDKGAGAVRMAQSRALDRLRAAMKELDHA